jgi:hypothetical protein
MTLYDSIIEIYPELSTEDNFRQLVKLRNDSDGTGDYIEEWNYSKPLPVELESFLRA